MRWRAVACLVACFISASSALNAQERASLSLEGAIDLAKQNSPIYRQTLNDLGPASWAVRTATANMFTPNADLAFFAGWQDAGQQRLGASTFSEPSVLLSQYQFSLSYQLNGNTVFGRGLSKAEYNAVERRVDDAELRLRSAVTIAYIEVLRLQARAEQAAREVHRSEEHLRLADAREQVGAGTRLETMQADVATGRAEIALLQARNAARVAKLRLVETLGVEVPAEQIELVSEFDIFDPNYSLAVMVTDATGQHPTLVAARADRAAAHSGVKVAKATYFPSLTLRATWSGFTREETNPSGTIDRTIANAEINAAATVGGCNTFADLYELNATPPPPPFDDCSQFAFSDQDALFIDTQLRAINDQFAFSFQNEPLSLSAFVTMPLFNGFQRQLDVERAIARRSDLQHQVRGLELQIRANVTEAVHNLDTAYQTVQLQLENTERAQEELRLARERYQLGAGTFLELLDSETLAAQAEVDQIEAIFGFYESLVQMEAAVGHSLPRSGE